MYKKEKRTKNLTLRDIHVGDWVQVWSPTTERYTPPMKITSIHDDGTVYLIPSEEWLCDPWEENIENVDALPITEEVLRGFGFCLMPKRKSQDLHEYYKVAYYKETLVGFLCKDVNGKTVFDAATRYVSYIHEYQAAIYENEFDIHLEWKGVNKQQESHETE